jgi:hypothetical protein
MTGEEIHQEDLVISKLLRQDIEKYKSLFPHVSAAIQLLTNTHHVLLANLDKQHVQVFLLY